MKSFKFAFVLAQSVLLTHGTLSAPISTPMQAWYLKFACEDASPNAQGFCNGAIEAFYSVIPNWCVPASVTHGQVKDEIRDFLKTLKEADGSRPASDVVEMAVEYRWPC